MLYLTSKTVNLLRIIWKNKKRVDPGLGYLTERIPSKFLGIEFVYSFVEGEFSIFRLVDSTDRNYSMRGGQYEGRVKYVVGEILILFTNDNLLFEIRCVDFKFIKLICRGENVQSWFFSIPKILVWWLEDKLLLWVFIDKTTHFLQLSFE